jgi:hypothetical protein
MQSLSKSKSIYIILSSILLLIFFNYWINAFQQAFYYVNTEVGQATVDFHIYYTAGKAILNQNYAYNSLFAENGHKLTTLNYPPTFFPFFALFSLWDYETARRIFLAFNFLVFGLSLFALLKYSHRGDREPILFLGIVLALLSAPLMSVIFHGQIALFVGCASFASFLFYLNGRKNISALCLATAVLIKLNPVLLLATFVLFFNDWKYLIRFIVAVVLVVSISVLFINPSLYWDFVTKILPNLAEIPPAEYMNQTPLRWIASNSISLLQNIGITLIIRLYTLFGLISLAIFAWFMGQKHSNLTQLIRNGTQDIDAVFVAYLFFIINISASMFLSARVWSHTYVWYIFPSLPVIIYAVRKTRWWFVLLVGLAVVGVTSQVLNQAHLLNNLNIIGSILWVVAGMIALFYPGAIMNKISTARE